MNHYMTIYDASRTRHKMLRRDHHFNNGIGFRSLCVTTHIHIMKSAIVFISLLIGAADCFAPRSAPLFTRSASRAERAPTAVRMADLVKVDKPNQQFAAGTAGFVIGAYLGGPILGAHHRPAKLVTNCWRADHQEWWCWAAGVCCCSSHHRRRISHSHTRCTVKPPDSSRTKFARNERGQPHRF